MNNSSRRSPRVSNKRKRDSELRSLNSLQLREAQEKVEQKCAKIAARVPAATPTSVTSLADLYAQMRRDSLSGASGQQPTSSVVPSTNTVPGNNQILSRMAQNSPRGHSISSRDDDNHDIQKIVIEIVISKHIPGPPRERASFESEAVLTLPTHSSQSSSKDKTSTPKSAATDGVHVFKYAVEVSSPPKRSTHNPTRVKREVVDLTA